MEIRYVAKPNTYIVRKAGDKPDATGSKEKLLGARVHVDLSAAVNGWAPVTDVPDENGNFNAGYIDSALLSPTQLLKIFYIDVGQGDAILIEAENATVLIDGGPNSGLHSYLDKRLEALRRADAAMGLPQRNHLNIDAVFVTHFDKDHYLGLTRVLKDPEYRLGTLYHNGLPRYDTSSNKHLNLGSVINHADGSRSLSTDLTDINSARQLLASGNLLTPKGNFNQFGKFLDALIQAHDHATSRVGSMQRLVARDPAKPAVITIGDLAFQVLAPLTTKKNGRIGLRMFPDPKTVKPDGPAPTPSASHTINGNTLVLRLKYKNTRFLFGGDLNQPAQKYLQDRYGAGFSVFQAAVNKACHHGSSDFDVDYLKKVSPYATIFSSGDDGNFDHPLPDAIGAAARHSTGDFPLVFSTELARDTAISGRVLLGHINARSDGDVIVMAQKKEDQGGKHPWHTFSVPYNGPFAGP